MNKFMEEAIKEAQKALKNQEVPIGAVIVKENKIISRGFNKREHKKNSLLHAEIVAIEKACKKLKDWRLEDCEIYVTLEPCPMCAGAILNSRIKKIYYGTKDKTAQDDLCEKILSSQRLNHKCEMVLLDEYEKSGSSLLTEFFKSKRK